MITRRGEGRVEWRKGGHCMSTAFRVRGFFNKHVCTYVHIVADLRSSSFLVG